MFDTDDQEEDIMKKDFRGVRRYVAVAVGLAAGVLVAHQSFAVNDYWPGSVKGIAVNNETNGTGPNDIWYGGCYVVMSTAPPNTIDCPSNNQNWISVDCIGEYNKKAQASAMLSQLQLAYVTGKSVNLVVEDGIKHDGLCIVQRVVVED